MEEQIKTVKVKTAGLVNGNWVVILDDGSILEGVQAVNINKNGDSVGLIKLDIAIL